MLYEPWSHWTRWCTSHYHQLQYLSNSKTTSNSCCINLGLTGPDGVQVSIISYDIYHTQKLLVTQVLLTLVTLDQMARKSIISYDIYQTLKLLVTHVVLTLAFKIPNEITKKTLQEL